MVFNHKKCLLIVFLLIGFSVINFDLGTNEIQRVWDSNTFICNMKLRGPEDICDKKFGFSLGSALELSLVLAIIVGMISKNTTQAVWLPFSVVAGWELLMEIFSRLLFIPMLYSWERSSLNYGFLTVFPGWLAFNALPLLMFTGVIIVFGLAGFGIKRLILIVKKLILL